MAVKHILIHIHFFTIAALAGAKKCTFQKFNSLQASNEILVEDYFCPRLHDPLNHTECCSNDSCCPVSLSDQLVDGWLLRIISISVMATCFCLVVLILTCCFWSKCPLYNTCRANYNSSNVIIYTLEQETDPLQHMPNDDIARNGYYPSKVKIRLMDDV